MKEKLKKLDSFQPFITICASIALPLVLAYYGNQFIASQNERTNAIIESQNKQANSLKYIEIAVGILRNDPADNNIELRKWAAEILKTNSTVPISDEAMSSLGKQKIKIDNRWEDTTVNSKKYGSVGWTKNSNIDFVETECKGCYKKAAK